MEAKRVSDTKQLNLVLHSRLVDAANGEVPTKQALVLAHKVIFLPKPDTTIVMKCCDITNVEILEGVVPKNLDLLEIASYLLWEGDIDMFVSVVFTIEFSQIVKIVRAVQHVEPMEFKNRYHTTEETQTERY